MFALPLHWAVMEPRGGGDALWALGDGPLFVLGSSCGPGLESQVRAVRLMVTAPPCKGVVAGGGAAVSQGKSRVVAKCCWAVAALMEKVSRAA